MRAIICIGVRYGGQFKSSLDEDSIIHLMTTHDIVVNELNFLDMQERNFSARWDIHVSSDKLRQVVGEAMSIAGLKWELVEKNESSRHPTLAESPRLVVYSNNHGSHGFEMEYIKKIISALESAKRKMSIVLDITARTK